MQLSKIRLIYSIRTPTLTGTTCRVKTCPSVGSRRQRFARTENVWPVGVVHNDRHHPKRNLTKCKKKKTTERKKRGERNYVIISRVKHTTKTTTTKKCFRKWPSIQIGSLLSNKLGQKLFLEGVSHTEKSSHHYKKKPQKQRPQKAIRIDSEWEKKSE